MSTKFPKIFILLASLLWGTGFLPAGPENSVQAQYVQLTAEQMKAALHCPTDASKAFVDDCFVLAARGILPESLILSAFQYAMRKPKNQWVYFEKTLILRCEKINIDLVAEMARLHKASKKD